METSRNKLEAQQPLPSCSEQTRWLVILDPTLQGKDTELEQSAWVTDPQTPSASRSARGESPAAEPQPLEGSSRSRCRRSPRAGL